MESVTFDLEKGRTSGDGMEEATELTSLKVEQKTETVTPTAALELERGVPRRKESGHAHANVHRKTSSGSGTAAINSSLPLPGLHTLYRRPETVTRSLAPVIPKGELVQMTPRLITTNALLPEHKKTKPPKFIPYEPYPGAVNPIVARAGSSSSGSITPKSQKVNKNNLDIGVLVSQMSTMRTQELEDGQKAQKTNDAEVEKLKSELKQMREQRDYFQGQFKFQTQVNSELKNLLVASVGEDLQTHVNVLTEDKLQLARALLDTANNLTTHTEQIEFLAGQCEVWRSKFLASSVMVEELARWKADLTQKNQMLSEANKRLLHSMHQLREMQLEILKSLKFVAKIRYLNLPSTDVISLSAENLNILQQMVLHSGVGIPEASLNISSASTNPLCEAEKYAVQALQFVSQPLMATDEAIRALFDQAQRPYGTVVASGTENTPSQVGDSTASSSVSGNAA